MKMMQYFDIEIDVILQKRKGNGTEIASQKKKKETVLPAFLVYEEIDGKALPYTGFKDVLTKKKKVEEII